MKWLIIYIIFIIIFAICLVYSVINAAEEDVDTHIWNQMGAMIDSFYKSDLISVNKALEIYRSALNHELLVFTNATLDQSRCME